MDTQVLKKEILLLRDRINDLENERRHLTEIGLKLSLEKNLSRLLDFILTDCRTMLHADGGSLYITEEVDSHLDMTDPHAYLDRSPPKKILRFMIAQNDSKDIPFQQFTLPINNQSIAGYVANNGKVLNLPDVHTIPPNIGIKFNPEFDRSIGYRTRSVLTLPLKNMENEVVGVLQLINKKSSSSVRLASPEEAEKKAIPFSNRDEAFLLSLSSQAAISIERAQLHEEIEGLISGMIESSITAIEARDKTTSGHSKRIGGYMVALARKINQKKEGPFKDIFFRETEIRELYYAALLHDIGKIGVPENILTKPSKITLEATDSIRWKLHTLRLLLQRVPPGVQFSGMKPETFLKEVDTYSIVIQNINKSGFLKDEDRAIIEKLSRVRFSLPGEAEQRVLSEDETENLLIQRGNLTDAERIEMNNHVVYSLKILGHIPWTRNLKQVPFIASTHHEKLDGTGYPIHLKGEQIPLGGRILAIVDIFEALTARDRPYKPPVPIEKALHILREEADQNHLDADLLELFISEEVYSIFTDEERSGLGEETALQILKNKGLF